MKKTVILSIVLMTFLLLVGCTGGNSDKNVITIYTSSDENVSSMMQSMLKDKFPDDEILIEYMPTGKHAARLLAEGVNTECDISYDLEYGYLEKLDKEEIFAKVKVDTSIFVDDLVKDNYVPSCRYGGAIVVNTDIMKDKGLDMPENYEDLLDPKYKDFIAMPNPKMSGTGYMFYKSLVNAWGEEKTIKYFSDLSDNILQYTDSGSGPVNMLTQGEIAMGFGMSSHAAFKISDGSPLEILIFDEGSPYTACGAAIIKGKEDNEKVIEIYDYIYEEITPKACEMYYPEKIYKNLDFVMDNYPLNINYSDMHDNTQEEKERLLELWPIN